MLRAHSEFLVQIYPPQTIVSRQVCPLNKVCELLSQETESVLTVCGFSTAGRENREFPEEIRIADEPRHKQPIVLDARIQLRASPKTINQTLYIYSICYIKFSVLPHVIPLFKKKKSKCFLMRCIGYLKNRLL